MGRWQTLKMRCFLILQHILPKKLLTKLAGKLTRVRLVWFKNTLIRFFIRRYSIQLQEAESPQIEDYPHFQAFFCRALKTGCRPIASGADTISSPCDGKIVDFGRLSQDTAITAKNSIYSLQMLLGSTIDANLFANGHYITIYLSPENYHRVHMPMQGSLKTVNHITGDLFSVQPELLRYRPQLFATNERVVALFETGHASLTMILVGAMLVGGIQCVWDSLPPPQQHGLQLDKGEEMGRFLFGSTVIMLLSKNTFQWRHALEQQQTLLMGQALGSFY